MTPTKYTGDLDASENKKIKTGNDGRVEYQVEGGKKIKRKKRFVKSQTDHVVHVYIVCLHIITFVRII